MKFNVNNQSTATVTGGGGFGEKWRDVLRAFDYIPNGSTLKTKNLYSKTDVVQIVGHYRKKIIDLESIVKFESMKLTNHMQEYSNMVE